MRARSVYPKVVGLAFLSPEAINIALDRKKWVSEKIPSERFDDWLDKDFGKRKRVAFLTDKDAFQRALRSKVDCVIAFCSWDWLRCRGLTVLDAEVKGKDLVHKTVTPHALFKAIDKEEPYKKSVGDVWIARGKPKDSPIRKKTPANKKYRTYSLANLIHIALNRSDETLLLIEPKKVWVATYQFAVGNLTEKKWMSQFSRYLKSAGATRNDLQNVLQWVERYGDNLADGKKVKPISDLDLRLAQKFGG